MGCAKASRLSKEEAEDQLKVSKSLEIDTRSFIEVVEACTQEKEGNPCSQEVVQKLEELEEKLSRLSAAQVSRKARRRRQHHLPIDTSLEELETNAREKLAELKRELQSLRSMDG